MLHLPPIDLQIKQIAVSKIDYALFLVPCEMTNVAAKPDHIFDLIPALTRH